MSLLVCASLASCKFFTMEPLRITGYSPERQVVPVESIDSVSVTFSADASQVLAESAFSLEENGVKMTGKFEWVGGRKLVFRPYKPFSMTSRYLISVSTAAEDTDGNSLEKAFEHEFRGLPDIERPRITNITPLNNSRIDTVEPLIEITFSEPMNRTSVLDGVSFSPAIDGFFVESPDLQTFTYRLEESLSWQTWYTITIRDSVEDAAGNTQGALHTCSFYTGTDSEDLAIISVAASTPALALIPDDPATPQEEVTEAIEKDSDIILLFSNPVDKETVPGNISISPAISMDFEWNEDGDELTVSLSKPFVYNLLYTLSINSALADIQGNTLRESSTYNIRTNGPGSRPPAVTRAELTNTFSSSVPVQPLTLLEPLMNFDFHPDLCSSACYGFLDLYISIADGATISQFQFLSSFSASAENASVTPIACQTGAGISYHAAEFPPDTIPGTEVIRIILEIDNSQGVYNDKPGKISFSLDNSFKDSLDNYLPETWAIDVYTTN